MKNGKFCSIPFLYIELQFKHTHCSRQTMSFTVTPSPWHTVVNLHSKRISSKGAELQARGGILDGKFLYLGKRAPRGSQLPTVHGSAFTLEQFNLVLFRKYRLNPLGQSQAAGSVTGSMNGVRVTHGTGSQLMVSASLRCASPILLLGSSCLAVLLAPASQRNYSIDHPAFRIVPGGGRAQGSFLITETVLGGPWSTRPTFMLCWITVQKGILHQKPQKTIF